MKTVPPIFRRPCLWSVDPVAVAEFAEKFDSLNPPPAPLEIAEDGAVVRVPVRGILVGNPQPGEAAAGALSPRSVALMMDGALRSGAERLEILLDTPGGTLDAIAEVADMVRGWKGTKVARINRAFGLSWMIAPNLRAHTGSAQPEPEEFGLVQEPADLFPALQDGGMILTFYRPPELSHENRDSLRRIEAQFETITGGKPLTIKTPEPFIA